MHALQILKLMILNITKFNLERRVMKNIKNNPNKELQSVGNSKKKQFMEYIS